MVATRCSWQARCSSSTICRPRWRSSIEVGSSTSSTSGSVMNARAIPTRWRSPPDNWPARRLRLSCMPTSPAADLGALAILRAEGLRPDRCTSSSSWSSAVSDGSRFDCWKTKPMRSRRSSARSRRLHRGDFVVADPESVAARWATADHRRLRAGWTCPHRSGPARPPVLPDPRLQVHAVECTEPAVSPLTQNQGNVLCAAASLFLPQRDNRDRRDVMRLIDSAARRSTRLTTSNTISAVVTSLLHRQHERKAPCPGSGSCAMSNGRHRARPGIPTIITHQRFAPAHPAAGRSWTRTEGLDQADLTCVR